MECSTICRAKEQRERHTRRQSTKDTLICAKPPCSRALPEHCRRPCLRNASPFVARTNSAVQTPLSAQRLTFVELGGQAQLAQLRLQRVCQRPLRPAQRPRLQAKVVRGAGAGARIVFVIKLLEYFLDLTARETGRGVSGCCSVRRSPD